MKTIDKIQRKFGFNFYKYQIKGINWLVQMERTNKGGILADESKSLMENFFSKIRK